MSFMDPLGFSSYAISPTYPNQPMLGPAMSPLGFDPGISSFTAIDPMLSPFGAFDPGISSFGGIQPNCYLPGYPPPYARRPSPYGDPNAGLSAMMGQLIQLFMSLFSSQGGAPADDIPDGGDEAGGDHTTPDTEPEVDPRERRIERLKPSEKNSDALKVLSIYASELGAHSGRLTKEQLQEFIDYDAKDKGVPQKVIDAAKQITGNEELYNLLCLQSENSPEEGFSVNTLDDNDWGENLDIDALEGSPSSAENAVETIMDNQTMIAALNSDSREAAGDTVTITRKDLEQIALGEADLPELTDREYQKLQAAALKLLSDSDTLDKIDRTVWTGAGTDTVVGTADDAVTYNNAKDKMFALNELLCWYNKHSD